MDIPCHKHCPDRAVGCHISCERYKEYRNYLDEKNEQIRKENILIGYEGRRRRNKDVEEFKNPKHYRGGNQN